MGKDAVLRALSTGPLRRERWYMRVLSTAWRYGLAVISCGVALALAIPLDAPSSCLFLAVMVSNLFGGKGPGILSVLLSSLAFDYFFLPPIYDLWIQPPLYGRFAAFLVPVLLITVVIEAKRRVEEARRQIDAKYRQVSADALAQAQRSEARLRRIIDTIPVPAWSSRADGATDFVNQRWLDYTGITEEQALGWGWKVVSHPNDLPSNAEYWRAVLAAPEVDRELEGRLRRFDGTYRWFLFRVCPLRDESGKVIQFYGTCIEIEDRKRAADALRASELKFRLIVHSIPGLVATMTPKGELELVNQPVLDYTGLAFDALKDWGATGLVPEDELPRVGAEWKRSVETGCEYDVEHHMRRADGAYRWFHVRGLPLRDNQGIVVRWYCVLTDIEDRKRTEEALRSREQQLRLMVDSIPALISIRTGAGEVEMVNRQCLEYTGMTLDQLKSWPEAVHPDDRADTVAQWKYAIESGNPLSTEVRARRADGVYRWFHCRALPLRDDKGIIIRWHTLYVDIEDRKRAEEALRSSEHQLRLLLDSIPALVSTMTPGGDTETVNQQLVAYTGHSPEELKNWPEKVHPEDRARIADRWRRSVETGTAYEAEERVRRADGVYRWFHTRGLPMRDAEGHIVRWCLLLSDIEDRRQAEQALRASEHHLRLMTETIPALVWRTTPDGEIDYVNRRVLEYTGKPLEYFGNTGWLQLLHPDDVDSTIRIWRQNTQTGEPHQVTYRLRRADGAYRWFDVRGEPLRDDEGRVAQWYGICIDVEDRRRTEEALRNTQERLSVASQIATVGELSASIAHEVNQPLTAVVSNGNACLRWLSAQPPNLAKAVEAAQRIVRDGKDAGEVVRRIRALFKRAAHEEVSLDLNEVVGEVLGLLHGETAKRRVIVETDLGQDLPPVFGDRVQLQQLILNLLLNGIEAMDPVTDYKRLFIRSKRESGDTVLVEIQDSGVGLKDLDTVFEAFFTTKADGMGMGLAICRSIVQAHNGRLWAASAEGRGATFCFTLPLQLSPVS
jgi:PAS domain S-box-containing protein